MQAITARYVQENENWAITVAGLGKELNDRAPGIIAARDRADQLVEKLAPEGATPTVVHLINGSALEFTSAYMTARLARTEPAPVEETPATEAPATPEAPAAEAEQPKADERPAAEDAPAAASKPTKAKESKGKRSVPRKELSKSPEPAVEQGARVRGADGRYKRRSAGAPASGLPNAAGSASATG
ncbi:hypothetical protein [Prauserella cavernicola]|uniref:hypothetical protein n=1 Tax=Prauserella cavernicola TaxID=2800127 RepID=UPI001E49E178|nr:hypothetical protein [Prauserella cavernicola]